MASKRVRAQKKLSVAEKIRRYKDIFVANHDGTFTCGECLATKTDIDPGDQDVEVWEVGSDGWTAPVVCKFCKLSLPVVVNG